MKINEIIRYYRKKENLTQEQVANYLNISAPAVNKWENGVSFPDITLLAPLARFLKIDVNTLLSFNEDLTDETVDRFVAEVINISETNGYEKAFERGFELIKQFPACDKLIYWIALSLRIELLISNIEEKNKYEKDIIEWLKLVSESNNYKIASLAKLDLASIYRTKKDYVKAQEILDKIPDVEVDKKFQQAVLFKSSGKLDNAYDICERILLENAQESLNIFIFIISTLCEEQKFDEAEDFLKSATTLVETFDLGEYHKYPLELLLAKEKNDKERIIKTIQNMMDKAESMGNSINSKLYKHISSKESGEKNKESYKNTVMTIIKEDDSLDFVKNDPRIKLLLE